MWSRICARAKVMWRDSSTTWILLVVRTSGRTFSPRIQSRCMTSRTSSATRMPPYAASDTAIVLKRRPSSRLARRGT